MIERSVPKHEAETDRLLRKLDESSCVLSVCRPKLKALIQPEVHEAERLKAEADKRSSERTDMRQKRRAWWSRLLWVITIGVIGSPSSNGG